MSGTYQSSMQYTIGTAIDRAHEQGHHVDLLLDGQWVSGLVVASDGQGVVLEGVDDEHTILRLERVSGVRVRASSPFRKLKGASGMANAPRTEDGAVPMPPPRQASD
jgi:hypothetical protein